MAFIAVPSLMRDLTGGLATVAGRGTTVDEVVHDVDGRYPGFASRLCVRGELDPALMVVVDQRPAPLGLRARVNEDSVIRFLPFVGGG